MNYASWKSKQFKTILSLDCWGTVKLCCKNYGCSQCRSCLYQCFLSTKWFVDIIHGQLVAVILQWTELEWGPDKRLDRPAGCRVVFLGNYFSSHFDCRSCPKMTAVQEAQQQLRQLLFIELFAIGHIKFMFTLVIEFLTSCELVSFPSSTFCSVVKRDWNISELN